MIMSFIKKLKSTFGNSNSGQLASHSDSTDAIIETIEQQPFAISEANVLYAGLNELGGYYFFQTVIVGAFHIKTKKGATLSIVGTNVRLELDSDSLEFESDPTDIKYRQITKIDFQVEAIDAAKIQQSKLQTLVLTCKKQELTFTIYDSDKEK